MDVIETLIITDYWRGKRWLIMILV